MGSSQLMTHFFECENKKYGQTSDNSSWAVEWWEWDAGKKVSYAGKGKYFVILGGKRVGHVAQRTGNAFEDKPYCHRVFC